MSFLFPLAGWLGLLSLPIIAFYLLKTRQRRRPVSTLLFWNQIRPRIENSPLWRKLRRWLSLALQLLILALIVCAIARPAFDWERKDPQRTVAILDPSASMGATSPAPRWTKATEELSTAIGRLRVQDEMAIITAENPPQILSGWTSGKRALREALSRAALQPTGTDPSAAFVLARELTATRENTQIKAFTDAVWPETKQTTAVEGISLHGIDPKPPINAGLTLFAIRRSPVAPGDWQLDAEVTATQSFKGTLELLRDGQPMDLVNVESEPGKSWQRSWRGSTEEGARFEAVLKVMPGDILPLDDRAACVLLPLSPLRLLVTGPPDPFLDAVLSSIPLVEWARVPAFPSPVPDNVDLVICAGGALPEGHPAVPILFIDPTRGGFWGELKGKLEDVPITDLNKKSHLLKHAGLSAVAIKSAGKWSPSPGAEVLASGLDSPLIFGQWDRTPRWMVIGFSPEESDLPLRTAFPVFIGNLLQSLRLDADLEKGAAVLPGPVESRQHPLAPPTENKEAGGLLPTFPGWWLVLFAGLIFLFAEWYLYNRRITD